MTDGRRELILAGQALVSSIRKELYEMMKQRDQLERRLEAAREIIAKHTREANE